MTERRRTSWSRHAAGRHSKPTIHDGSGNSIRPPRTQRPFPSRVGGRIALVCVVRSVRCRNDKSAPWAVARRLGVERRNLIRRKVTPKKTPIRVARGNTWRSNSSCLGPISGLRTKTPVMLRPGHASFFLAVVVERDAHDGNCTIRLTSRLQRQLGSHRRDHVHALRDHACSDGG